MCTTSSCGATSIDMKNIVTEASKAISAVPIMRSVIPNPPLKSWVDSKFAENRASIPYHLVHSLFCCTVGIRFRKRTNLLGFLQKEAFLCVLSR